MEGPRRVGRYELVERVARGNQGLLYRGRDTLLDREVAVKILLAGFQDDPDARDRFFQEAKAAARLQHPNIVTTFALGEDDDTPYIVMEFLHGRTLADRLAEGTPVPLTDGLHIAIQACAGLAYAHQHGVLHRAINPGNVWLCNDLTVKLLDCGIATAIASATTVSASLNQDRLPRARADRRPRLRRAAATCSRSAWSCTNCSPAGAPSRPVRQPR